MGLQAGKVYDGFFFAKSDKPVTITVAVVYVRNLASVLGEPLSVRSDYRLAVRTLGDARCLRVVFVIL